MKRYAIWGAGTVGKLLYEFLKDKGVKIDFFIDENKKGEWQNIPIKHPSEISDIKDVKIILSLTSQVYYKIPSFVKNYNVEDSKSIYDYEGFNLVTLTDFIRMYPEFFRFLINKHKFLWWKDIDKGFYVDKNEITLLEKYLADDRSKDLFKKHVCMRSNYSEACYPFPDTEPQYFIDEVLKYFENRSLTFVDVGAYKGDTVVWLFYFFGKKVENVYAFEPSLENQKYLIKTLGSISKVFNKSFIVNIPLILSDNMTKIFFSDEGSSSGIKSEGIYCFAMPLDSLLYNLKVNFIKIDVEGQEIEVLKGMKNTISRNRPLMAVAVYHKLRDIIDIPLFILENFNSYRFILRQHRHFGLETILYCVPGEV